MLTSAPASVRRLIRRFFMFSVIIQGFIRIVNRCLDILYPRRCPVCDQIVMPKGALICRDCFTKLSYVKGPVCKKCGKQVFGEMVEYCYDCTRHKRSFAYGVALLNYDEKARHSMTRIKYRNKRQYLDFYAEAICRRYKDQIMHMKAQALIPVPIHASRRRQRGFNQAELLARGIGLRLNIPVYEDVLIRNKKTAPQKQLNPEERLHNLEKAFEASNIPDGVKDVILVDDIYTTGSTLEACTRVLLAAGFGRVYIITICIGREV